MNLPINKFVCTAYLKSGVLETNDNHLERLLYTKQQPQQD